MNRPPAEFVAMEAGKLRGFAVTVLEKSGAPPERAAFLADLLVRNDLRGVFSHGTRLVANYAPDFRDGRTNPDPQIRVIADTPATLTVDGDGGLGYFPAHNAANAIAGKAKEMGIAAAVTRNHGHIGAAGIYGRVILERDLFGYVTSGHQLDLRPDWSVLAAAGGSPMCFAIPTGEEPPFVLDFGATQELHGRERTEKLLELAPSAVIRSMGLGFVCQALGGFLAGVPVDPARAERRWPGANQGSFMIAVDLARFASLPDFKREMDEYARRVREMRPLPGFDRALLPGTLERDQEARYQRDGIPVGPRHAEDLRKAAKEFGVESPV